MCSKTDVGDVYAQVMPCAFGTFWKVGENACDSSRLVDCPNGRSLLRLGIRIKSGIFGQTAKFG